MALVVHGGIGFINSHTESTPWLKIGYKHWEGIGAAHGGVAASSIPEI